MSTAEAPRPESTDPCAPRLRLRGPLDIAEAIPFLFGYYPEESLVILGIERGRVGLSMRLDLCPDFEAIVESSVEALRSGWPAQAIIAIYSAGRAINAPLLSARLRTRLNHEAVAIKESILVRDGRCYSLLCTDPRCCPTTGWVIPVADEVMVAAMAGALGVSSPAHSREDLARSLLPVTGADALAMGAALDGEAGVLATAMADCASLREREALRAEAAREAIQRVEQAVELWHDTCLAALSAEDAAWLIIAMIDVSVRDTAITHCLGADSLEPYEELYVELSRRAVDGWGAGVLTLAGLLAWQRGSGTRARIAVERALHEDPEYRLALLLQDALDRGLPPQAWAHSLRA